MEAANAAAGGAALLAVNLFIFSLAKSFLWFSVRDLIAVTGVPMGACACERCQR